MSMKPNNQDSKQRILDAALDVFYEVGFEGARVDDIAKRAQVNKALIYYYFKSKEELLTELININIDEMLLMKSQVLESNDTFNISAYKEASNKMIDMLKHKKKILSILLGEILKNSNNEKISKGFEFFFPIMEDSIERMRAIGVDQARVDEGIIAGFFFGMMPVITYITIGEKWADCYGFDKSYLEDKFTGFLNDFFIENFIQFLKKEQP
ncbi:AcrR family transcriptional regulator [Anaerosolibacter carboniphilus]|uniref:AcrR family transcriptional regulator n=1 Tax=Anaerosolibacter carboniphilus TaxID=1417629 RepID=A0A841KLC0_9FIRM|nr:TetR/AcrR family transcriptional regulator [Anaerosolibacter carboniphilus]MBB6214203.1 AcrR family transcriptional regulator [Anaerosolibacter carboniphilus]